MQAEHEKHLEQIKQEAIQVIDSAYRGGQEEHGGRLWEKENLLDEAIKEATDQLVYLLSERQRRRGTFSPASRSMESRPQTHSALR